MIKNIILVTLILSLFLVGCQKVEEKEVTPTEQPAETPVDISIESDVSEVNSINNELNTEELDNLESELDEINW